MADPFKDVSVDEITPGLFVGNTASVENERALRDLKITAVVSVVSRYRRPFPPPAAPHGPMGRHRHPLERLFHARDRIAIYVDDSSSENIFRHFEGACKFIDYHLRRVVVRDPAGFDRNARGGRRGGGPVPRDHSTNKTGRVLVHCTLGQTRSVAIVAAYLMWRWRRTASEALQDIRKRRSMSCPNDGFIDQLLVWQDLRCNPWSNPRSYSRPRAYHDMVRRLDNHKRVRQVTRAVERAARENAPRGRTPTRDSRRVHFIEDNAMRCYTRAGY